MPTLIIKHSDFRSDVGEVADVISFAQEFLHRYPGDNQRKVLTAINGDKGGEWSIDFSEIALEIGMKGGKNWILEIDAAFTMYYINCLINPHEYFSKITKRLLPYTIDKTFDLINVSVVDENQARRAFFDSVKKAIKLTMDPKAGENWFAKYAGLDIREEYGHLKKSEIEFPTIVSGAGGIRVMSFNSEASAPEGLHMLKFYADELSRADSKPKYRQAQKLYELGLNNTSVSFPGRVGKTIGWAYPNDTEYDLAHERYQKSFENESIFGLRLTTFDFNPSITRDMFNDRYKADPLTSLRVYECVKPVSKNNFYQPYTEKLREAIDFEIENKIVYVPAIITRKDKTGKLRTFSSINILKLKGDKRQRCVAYDLGISKDRLVIACGYLETINPRKLEIFIGDEIEVITTNKVPIIDVMIVIEPTPGNPSDMLGVGDIMNALINAFPNIITANSDHFQNETLRQQLISKRGVNANTYHFSNTMQTRLYTIKRAAVWNNNLIIAKDTEANHKIKVGSKLLSIDELWVHEGEQLFKQGNKIDHPEHGSKDVQDVFAILTNDLMNLEAEGVIGMASNLETMSDEQLRDLANKYIDEHFNITESGIEDEKTKRQMLAKFLEMNERDINKLAIFIKEEFGYPY